jgi:hypothetical protein
MIWQFDLPQKRLTQRDLPQKRLTQRELVHCGAESVGQRVGVGRFGNHLLQPDLGLGPLLRTAQVDSYPPSDVSPNCLSYRRWKGVPEKRPAALDELVDLIVRERPEHHGGNAT